MEKQLKKYFAIFLLPTIISVIVFFIFPFIFGLFLSFYDFTTVIDRTFVGFNNYILAFQDPMFNHSFWFTLVFVLVTIIIVTILGFLLALILTKNIKGTNIFRTTFFMPNLIGGIVLGYIWQLIINGILAKYGVTIAIDEKYGFWGLVILNAWQQIGYMMIIFIAGLQAIPQNLYEAADIDGANWWVKLKNVTLPMLMPTITICTFLTMTRGFKLFDPNLALTAGEPAQASAMLALNIYHTFYGRVGWMGVGQAKAVIFCLIVIILGAAQLYFTRRKEVTL